MYILYILTICSEAYFRAFSVTVFGKPDNSAKTIP